MKNFQIIFLLFALCFFSIASYSQKSCKVLKPEIAKNYKGKCKKGLAHGKGVASGVDKFEGQFRKGLPHGYGTYKWEGGQVYNGQWKEGLRHGEGSLTFEFNERDSLLTGIWENDVYKGPKPVKPYKIVIKRNIDRYTVKREKDGNRVLFYLFQNGLPNSNVSQLMVLGDAGTETSLGSAIGYDQITFPFACKVNYRTWNKLRTVQFDVVFEIEIDQPGEWKIMLHN